MFILCEGAASWKSSKATCILRSATESEFIALDKSIEEAKWLRNFFENISCWEKPMMHCNSMSTIGKQYVQSQVSTNSSNTQYDKTILDLEWRNLLRPCEVIKEYCGSAYKRHILR